MKLKLILILSIIAGFTVNAQVKILFDAKKAETAGNADWVIDADFNTLGFSTGVGIPGTGSESNPQRIPSPAQSTITATTPENYWKGALSYWAIDCVKQGYIVETLPNNGQITFMNAANVQDLSNYKIYVVVEPNISFTLNEKNAIISFVQNGGSLFMISDHDISDRNGDGVDSPTIFNDMMANNTVQANPFGITYNLLSISPNSFNIANLPSNAILHGSFGNVTQIMLSAGTSMTLNTSNNPTAIGLIYTTGATTTGTINVLCSTATFGAGKIVALGDSSIPDDDTGDVNDNLYDGYITDAAGNHQKLLMNAMIWLAGSNLSTNNFDFDKYNFSISQNPAGNNELKINYNLLDIENITIEIFDNLGRLLKTEIYNKSEIGYNSKSIALNNVSTGIYICKMSNNSTSKTLSFIVK